MSTNDSNAAALDAELLADDAVSSREQLCVVCRVDAGLVIEFVRHGVVHAIDRDARRFSEAQVRRFRRALRIQREFEVELAALALVVDLMDRIDAQRNAIATLERALERG